MTLNHNSNWNYFEWKLMIELFGRINDKHSVYGKTDSLKDSMSIDHFGLKLIWKWVRVMNKIWRENDRMWDWLIEQCEAKWNEMKWNEVIVIANHHFTNLVKLTDKPKRVLSSFLPSWKILFWICCDIKFLDFVSDSDSFWSSGIWGRSECFWLNED
jgi:hypothetical protein